jgi:hypothetical protein
MNGPAGGEMLCQVNDRVTRVKKRKQDHAAAGASGFHLVKRSVWVSTAQYQCAIKPAINGNGHNECNNGTFPFIISASSVFSVAIITNRYNACQLKDISITGVRLPLKHPVDGAGSQVPG